MCTLNISPLRVEECERAADLGRPMFAVVWPKATGGIQERGAGPVPVADRLQDFARGGLGKGG